MAKTETFAYHNGSSGIYDWSAGANWSTGTLPATGAHLRINAGPAGDVTRDNIVSLRISSLYLGTGATAEIGAGDTLTVGGGIVGGGTIDLLGSGSSLAVGGALGASVAFAAGATGETLVLTTAKGGKTAAAITGLARGDRIDLRQFGSVTSARLSGTTLIVRGVLAGSGTIATHQFTDITVAPNVAGFTFAADGAGGTVLDAACFAAGTRILTERGEVPVEALEIGDVAILRHPSRIDRLPIRWIGRLRVNLAHHPRPEAVAPIRFIRDCVAPGVPARDLLLSPEHGVFLDGRLIAARSLVNGMTVVREAGPRAIEYFHIETEPHAVVLAEGLPAETYLDTGNRAVFENSGPVMLHPDFQLNSALRSWEADACAPLAITAEQIAPSWHALAVRARTLGFQRPMARTTRDAAPVLRVGPTTLDPVVREDDRLVFLLPRGTNEVVLESRWGCPADLMPWCNDHRRLGLPVREVRVSEGEAERVIPVDHPGLSLGWQTMEEEEGRVWRWTDGAARLRLDTDGPAVVTFLLAGTTTYCLAPGTHAVPEASAAPEELARAA